MSDSPSPLVDSRSSSSEADSHVSDPKESTPASSSESNAEEEHKEEDVKIDYESFGKLQPLHYLIFDILKNGTPTLILRVNQELYDELVPKLYRRTIMTEHNYEKLMFSAMEYYVDGEGKPLDDEADPVPGSQRTLDNFSRVKCLSFIDPAPALTFINDVYGHRYDESRSIASNVLFPNIQRLHFGRPLLYAATFGLVDEDDECDERLRDQFFPLMLKHTRVPHVCVDWPERRVIGNDAETVSQMLDGNDGNDSDDEENAYTAEQEEMGIIITSIGRHGSVKRCTFHLSPMHLPNAVIPIFGRDFNDVELDYQIETDSSVLAHTMLTNLWHHFLILMGVNNHQHRVSTKYYIPRREDFESAMTTLRDEEASGDSVMFSLFEDKILTREQDCPCREGLSTKEL